MKNKIKYLSFLIVLGLISIIPFAIKERVKATDYLHIQVIQSGSIEDLPDEDTTNTWQIDSWVYCQYNYNGNLNYLLDYYHKNTSNGVHIIYTNEKFTNNSILEYEDQEYALLYSPDLKILLDTLKSYLYELNLDTNSNKIYYINYNTLENIGYYQSGTNNTPMLVTRTYEDYYSNYINNFGILNSIYQQYNFYNMTINYLNHQITNNEYQQGVSDTTQYYESLISNINQNYRDIIDETASNTYQVGYDSGHDDGYEEGYLMGYRAINQIPDVTIYNMRDLISAVSMYPIHFFTNGLNVNIFGVNLGNLLLGIFMIGLLIIIIRMIIGIIRGGK